MSKHFYYSTCPLCQQDVDISQTDFYRVLPLDCERVSIFYEKPVLDESPNVISGLLRNGGSYISCTEDYPSQEYMNKAWVLHMRCISLVNNIPPQQLHRLLDLVEPTFTSRLNPPSSAHGAFYAQPICKESPSETPGAALYLSRAKQIMMSFWEATRDFIISYITWGPEKDLAKRTPLPADIWNLILQYDIGRLAFVTRTASQLTKFVENQPKAPCSRFAVHVLHLTGPTILIHLTTVGGRSYISNLTNPVDDGGVHPDTNIKCFSLFDCKYLAVKTDGVGVVDIAFAKQDGQPKWALRNSTYPFARELSEIKDTNFQGLRIVRDSLKCRAIVPSNRGAEPYFNQAPFPPDECWVNSSLSLEVMKLTKLKDPFIYFTSAIYIPFATLSRIGFFYLPFGHGIQDIHVNDPSRKPETHSVVFTQTPTELKKIVCWTKAFRVSYFVFIQFNVDGHWVPDIPAGISVDREILVKDVVGIWVGKTFPFIPVYIDTVVSQPTGD